MLAGLLLIGGNALADTLPPVGAVFRNRVTLFGKPVPLPPGDWTVASSGFGRVEGGDPGVYGAIGGVLLVPVTGERRGFVLAHTNVLPVRGGWGQPAECADDAALFREVTEPRDLHHACAFVTLPPAGRPVLPDAPAMAGADAVPLPARALVAGLRVSDRRDVVDVRYGFATLDWDADPERPATVERLALWLADARPRVVAALRTPESGPDGGPLPEPPLILPAQGDADGAGEMSTLRFAVYKLLTYRVMATSSSLLVSSAVTGSVATAAWLAVWQGLTHSGVYFANELAWEWPERVPVMSFTRKGSAP